MSNNPPNGPSAAPAMSRGSPEGRYLDGPGKAGYRLWTNLQAALTTAVAKVKEFAGGLSRAQQAQRERRDNHRGGDRTWLLRSACA